MENKTLVALKYHFILNIVKPSPGRRLNDIQIDLLSLAVENNRGLIGLADLLKNGCLARVGSPDDENAEATGFLAKLLGTGVLIAIDDG